MLDPLSAISLAGAILQFVDFSTKLVSGSLELYKSVDGAFLSDVEFELAVADLGELYSKLANRSQANANSQPPSGDEIALKNLVNACYEITRELTQALDDRKIRGSHRKWQSFRKALAAIWNKKELEQLEERLRRLQDQINHRLIAMMSEQQSEFCMTLNKIADDGLQTLKEEILEAISRSTRNFASKPSIDDLSEKIAILAQSATTVAKEQQILKSLQFREWKTRQSSVKDAQNQTFQWIFESEFEGSGPPTGFRQWLENENGSYWIGGKPGSGKSTLMKYLIHEPRTYECLSSWAGNNQLVTANFFFWKAGSPMQKSQQGLLQSLVCEILLHHRELIPAVCLSRWQACNIFHEALEPWTRDELFRIVLSLTHQDLLSANFCFFIDGLDEYDGDTSELIHTLTSLHSLPNIKLCLSSRPWNEFSDAFATSRSIMLQDYTKNDIRLYIHKNLKEDCRFESLAREDPRYEDLIEEMVEMAQGVFLWVFLVVRDLLRGLTNADDIFDLEEKLRRFPPDLETYFQHMIDNIDGFYREQTARIFRVTVEATGPLSVAVLANIEKERLNPQYWLDPVPLKVTSHNMGSLSRNIEKRLNARCKGLLEITVDRYSHHRVNFLHRTVRDFLQAPGMRNLLATWTPQEFNPKMSLCKAIFVLIKSLLNSNSGISVWEDCSELFDSFMCYASAMEDENGLTDVELLDTLDGVLSAHSKAAEAVRDHPARTNIGSFLEVIKSGGILARAIEQPLPLYVTEKLNADVCLIQIERDRRPLLDWALRPTMSIPRTEKRKIVDWVDLEIVSLLLGRGALPNQPMDISMYGQGVTVWAAYLATILTKNSGRTKRNFGGETALFMVTAKLIECGADPYVRIRHLGSVSEILQMVFDLTSYQRLENLLARNRLHGFWEWIARQRETMVDFDASFLDFLGYYMSESTW